MPKITHGLSHKVSEYRIWKKMRERCLNKNCRFFYRYGGRGITICNEWNDFSVFYRDMGTRPTPKHTLERIDNNGPYSKDNCRWATVKEQQNNRADNIFILYNGELKTISQWNEHLKLPFGLLWNRIRRRKWSVERALTEPIQVNKRNHRKFN